MPPLKGKVEVTKSFTFYLTYTVWENKRVDLCSTKLTVWCRSLSEWQALVGQDPGGPLHMEYERESGRDVSSPKHGKVSGT